MSLRIDFHSKSTRTWSQRCFGLLFAAYRRVRGHEPAQGGHHSTRAGYCSPQPPFLNKTLLVHSYPDHPLTTVIPLNVTRMAVSLLIMWIREAMAGVAMAVEAVAIYAGLARRKEQGARSRTPYIKSTLFMPTRGKRKEVFFTCKLFHPFHQCIAYNRGLPTS